mgnify:CR=1 FL=1
MMMFLQYFYLGCLVRDRGNVYGYTFTIIRSAGVLQLMVALAIATMISAFFVGMIADRFLRHNASWGCCIALGAALLFSATTITNNAAFYWVILFCSLLYMPTDCIVKQHCFFSDE